MFTLSSELPFLATLLHCLPQVLFLFIQIPKYMYPYVTQCSPSLKENHIDKNLVNILQVKTNKTPLAVKKTRKISCVYATDSYFKDSPFIKRSKLDM